MLNRTVNVVIVQSPKAARHHGGTGQGQSFSRVRRKSAFCKRLRYKSILCQKDAYLTELVRYIHLNPLRAGLVDDLNALDKYPYAGHGVILGKHKNEWQSTEAVLASFSGKSSQARRRLTMSLPGLTKADNRD